MTGDDDKEAWRFGQYIIYYDRVANYRWQTWVRAPDLIKKYAANSGQDPDDYLREKRGAVISGVALTVPDVLILNAYDSVAAVMVTEQMVGQVYTSLPEWRGTPLHSQAGGLLLWVLAQHPCVGYRDGGKGLSRTDSPSRLRYNAASLPLPEIRAVDRLMPLPMLLTHTA